MNKQFERREFIKLMSITGMSLAFPNPLSKKMIYSDKNDAQLKNDYFSFHFNSETGRFTIIQNNGAFSLLNGTTRANTLLGKRSISEKVYNHSLDIVTFKDPLGNGKKLTIHSKDGNKELDFKMQVSLYDKWQQVIIETKCTNVSNRSMNLKSIEPICAIEEIGSSISWEGVSKVLTNGAMYYDAGMIHDFGIAYKEPAPYGPTKGGILSPDFHYPAENRVRSWWNLGFFRGYDKEGLVCGFIDNKTGLGQLIASKNSSSEVSLYTESVFSPGFMLPPGKSISSNKFMINIDKNPYLALEKYAQVMGIFNSAKSSSIVNGWCSWFYTYGDVTEDEVIKNAEFVSKKLKRFGLDYIQIDEGYQKFHGDWEGNSRFPHGMKWLADKIKSFGLKPGLWIAPYIVSEPTEIFQKNPDWFLKKSDSSFMRVGPWPSEDTDWFRNENPKRYGLDITHPDAAKWFYDLFDTIGNKWGYEMIKIDFVAWSIFSAHHFYDASKTPAQVYRQGLEIIRKAIGSKKHINDCGPGNVSVGLIDSMRIELDQNYGYSKAAWQQYFLDSSSSSPAAAKRYYYHKNSWINDADHVCINLLSIPKAQAAATIIGLSGGNIISGDRLINMDTAHLDILEKIYPSYGEAAKPVDLFDTDKQTIFASKIQKSFGSWYVIGFFNPHETEAITKELPLERFWLDPNKTYLAYDFWMQKFFGEITNSIKVTLQPASVTLLAVHEKLDRPQVLSTDRHVLQGAHELENVKWDEANHTLPGTSLGVLNTSHNIYVYLPTGQSWVQGINSLYHDFENFSVKFVDDQIVQVHVRFETSEKVDWYINFFESFK